MSKLTRSVLAALLMSTVTTTAALAALVDTFPVGNFQGNPITLVNGQTPTGWFAQNLSGPTENIAVWVVRAPGP